MLLSELVDDTLLFRKHLTQFLVCRCLNANVKPQEIPFH